MNSILVYINICIVQKCFTEYTVKVFNFHGVNISLDLLLEASNLF